MKFSQAVCKQFALVKQEKWGQQTGDKIKELIYFHTLPIFQNGLIWFSQRFLKKNNTACTSSSEGSSLLHSTLHQSQRKYVRI